MLWHYGTYEEKSKDKLPLISVENHTPLPIIVASPYHVYADRFETLALTPKSSGQLRVPDGVVYCYYGRGDRVTHHERLDALNEEYKHIGKELDSQIVDRLDHDSGFEGASFGATIGQLFTKLSAMIKDKYEKYRMYETPTCVVVGSYEDGVHDVCSLKVTIKSFERKENKHYVSLWMGKTSDYHMTDYSRQLAQSLYFPIFTKTKQKAEALGLFDTENKALDLKKIAQNKIPIKLYSESYSKYVFGSNDILHGDNIVESHCSPFDRATLYLEDNNEATFRIRVDTYNKYVFLSDDVSSGNNVAEMHDNPNDRTQFKFFPPKDCSFEKYLVYSPYYAKYLFVSNDTKGGDNIVEGQAVIREESLFSIVLE